MASKGIGRTKDQLVDPHILHVVLGAFFFGLNQVRCISYNASDRKVGTAHHRVFLS